MEVNTRVQLSLLLVLINFNQENFFCLTQEKNTGQLIFEENFNSNELNKSFWSREIKIPLEPDYEFCVFHKDDETIQINNGILRIKPRLFEDSYGEDSIFLGQLRLADCTSSIPQECHQQAASYNILPPVISAKIVTKNHFEFRYGVIEVRAKFPEGDWIYPQIWLEPLYKSYDKRHAHARVYLGRARGNAALVHAGNPFEEFGGKRLEFGLGNGTGVNFQENIVHKTRGSNSSPWTKDFHIYKTVWTSQGFTFYVDGELVGKLWPTEDGWSSDDNVAIDPRLTAGMVPFDEKFYLSIGLGVGGIRVFPDGTLTNAHPKPWKNISAKAMLLYWQAREKWLPTWRRNTALEIDYVKVWALD